MSIFDLRSLLPRARRRHSIRETAKGVVGEMAGRPRSAAESAKRARRRALRRKDMKTMLRVMQANPSGSKVVRRAAKAAFGGRHTYLEAQRRMRDYFEGTDGRSTPIVHTTQTREALYARMSSSIWP